MNSASQTDKFWTLPLLIGGVACLTVAGHRMLDPSNIAWLGHGDPVIHYLGWAFFRDTPWLFPLGSNPRYGLEIANSIVYSDSCPLFALAFKILSPILSDPFQYFGFWILCCFVLQSWFGWQLVGLTTSNPVLRGLSSTFFAFSPAMIWRLHPKIGHLSLTGHFLILAGLYLCLAPSTRRHRALEWGALLALASLVHAYLLVMVSVLWAANLLTRLLSQEITLWRSAGEGLITLGGIIFVCWSVGYFAVGNGTSLGGYGVFKADLLTFFDPGKTDYGLWSNLLGDLPGDASHHEGFNFLGMGLLLLLPFAIFSLKSHRLQAWTFFKRQPALVISLLLLFLYSLTHRISVGGLEFEIPVSESLLYYANIFRASGRMLWPFYYAIILMIVILVIQGYSPRTAGILLAVGLTIQIVDTSAGWMTIRRGMMVNPSSNWTLPFGDPFWEKAALKYKKIRYVPANGTHSQLLPAFAATHHMATDIASLARISADATRLLQERAWASVVTGHYDTEALYVIDDANFTEAQKHLNHTLDAIFRVDGFNVIAPDWNAP